MTSPTRAGCASVQHAGQLLVYAGYLVARALSLCAECLERLQFGVVEMAQGLSEAFLVVLGKLLRITATATEHATAIKHCAFSCRLHLLQVLVVAVTAAQSVEQVFLAHATLRSGLLHGCQVCVLFQSFAFLQFLLVCLARCLHGFLRACAATIVGYAFGHARACLLYVDLVEGVERAKRVQCVVGFAGCLLYVVDSAQKPADVAVVERRKESFVQSLRRLHRAAPLVEVLFIGKERILGHVERGLGSTETDIEEFQRVDIDGELVGQLLHDAASLVARCAHALHLLLGFGDAGLQLLQACAHGLAEVALLLFLRQGVVGAGHVVVGPHEVAHLVLGVGGSALHLPQGAGGFHALRGEFAELRTCQLPGLGDVA